MKDTELDKILQFKNAGGALLPLNPIAEEYMLLCRNNETLYLKDAVKRDISMHRCYMALINFIYQYMPITFKNKIPSDKFYVFCKHVQGKYKVHYAFIDEQKISDILDYCLGLGIDAEKSSSIAAKFGRTQMIEYDSISFGRMSQKTFKKYISEQMPILYEEVLGRYFEGDVLTGIIETIESDFERFMQKLI